MNTVLNEKTTMLRKCITAILLSVSAIFNFLFPTLVSYSINSGRNPLFLTDVSRVSSLLFLAFTVMMIVSLFLNKDNKLQVFALVSLVCMQTYSTIALIRNITYFSQYDMFATAVKESVLIFVQDILLLAIFVVFLIDAIKFHKIIKISKTLGIVGAVVTLIVTIFYFLKYSMDIAVVSNWAVILFIAMIVYYFRIADQHLDIVDVENELIALKKANESGLLSDEDYAAKRQNALNMLGTQSLKEVPTLKYNYGVPCIWTSIAVQILSLIIGIATGSSSPSLSSSMAMIFVLSFVAVLFSGIVCIVCSDRCNKRQGRVLGIVFTSLSALVILVILISLVVTFVSQVS